MGSRGSTSGSLSAIEKTVASTAKNLFAGITSAAQFESKILKS